MEQQGFDLRVSIVDPKTKRVVKHQPYQLKITNGVRIFIRDGVKYYENGTRVDPVVAQQVEEAPQVPGPHRNANPRTTRAEMAKEKASQR